MGKRRKEFGGAESPPGPGKRERASPRARRADEGARCQFGSHTPTPLLSTFFIFLGSYEARRSPTALAIQDVARIAILNSPSSILTPLSAQPLERTRRIDGRERNDRQNRTRHNGRSHYRLQRGISWVALPERVACVKRWNGIFLKSAWLAVGWISVLKLVTWGSAPAGR